MKPPSREGPPAPLPAFERCLAAAGEITDILGAARNLGEAAPDLLRSIGIALGAEAASVFERSAAEDALRLIAFWTRDGTIAPATETASRERSFLRGVGLPGEAWMRRRPQWVTSVGERGEMPRREAFAKDGIRGVLDVAIRYGDLVYGVVEACWRDDTPPGELLVAWLDQVGKQIGQYVAREEAMRGALRNKRLLDDLFENAPVGIHVTDAEGRLLRPNRRALQKLGHAREEAVGRPWREFFVDPTVADRLLEALSVSAPGEEVGGTVAELKRKDGTRRWIRINANARWQDGKISEIRAFLRDETDVRRAEASVRDTEERYRRLIEGAHEYALHTLDETGRVTGWNLGAQRLFGWSPDEIQGKDFGASFTPEDRADGVPERMLKLAIDEGRFQHEGIRVRQDGTRFGAEVLYTALRDPSGKLLEVSQLTRDISERQRLESLRKKSTDLEIANRQVVEVARRSANLMSAVAEAMEGPLATIETESVRLAAADPHRHRALREGVAKLRGAVRDLDALVVEEPQASGEKPESVDLARLAVETRDLLQPAAGERRVRVDADVDPSLVGVDADPVRLRQVVYNLLSNGIKFSRERGRVSLHLLPEGEAHFRIEVEDSGIGLSTDEIAALLKDTGTGDEAAAEGLGGVGLGLAATRRIVEQQGGRLGIQSTPGRGSVFFAVLPRTPGRPRTAASAEAEPSSARRVLAVSEDSSTRAGISWTLGSAGYDVLSALTAEEALDLARESRFDIVIVDLRLDGTTPTEFAAMLRAEGASRDAPCFVVALGSREYGVAGLVAADILPRPAPADRLFAALERARVPRGRDSRIWVVDGDLAVCKATARTLDLLGYQSVAEPDANAALKAVAEAAPAALLLGPFPLGMDAFAFLHHFRGFPSAETIPVLLMLPRTFEGQELESLEEVAAHAAKDGQWHRALVLVGMQRD